MRTCNTELVVTENGAHRVPAISVLVPIYNVEKYLHECLDSLRSQTFTDFEAICINDGSTDSSLEIIRSFMAADSRFRVIDKPNSGYGASMNRGLDSATGSFIAVLESDDIMYPDALQKLYDAAERFGADAVKGNFTFYWSDPEKADQFHEMFPVELTEKLIDTRKEMGIFYQKAAIWSGLYRRSFLESNAIRFLETPGASYQDSSFAFKIWSSADKAVLIHNPIIRYRQDNEASSVNSKGKVFCVCDEYAEIDRWLEERKDHPHFKPDYCSLTHIAQVSKYNAYLWNYDRLADEYKLEFLQRMRDEFKEYESQNEIQWAKWDSWRALNLRTIIDEPNRYARARNKPLTHSATEKIIFALKLGGPSALAKAVLGRISR